MDKCLSHSHQVFNMGPNYCTPSRPQVEKGKHICRYAGFIVWLRKRGEEERTWQRIHSPSESVSITDTSLSLIFHWPKTDMGTGLSLYG